MKSDRKTPSKSPRANNWATETMPETAANWLLTTGQINLTFLKSFGAQHHPDVCLPDDLLTSAAELYNQAIAEIVNVYPRPSYEDYSARVKAMDSGFGVRLMKELGAAFPDFEITDKPCEAIAAACSKTRETLHLRNLVPMIQDAGPNAPTWRR